MIFVRYARPSEVTTARERKTHHVNDSKNKSMYEYKNPKIGVGQRLTAAIHEGNVKNWCCMVTRLGSCTRYEEKEDIREEHEKNEGK